jgi:hypothetical protein
MSVSRWRACSSSSSSSSRKSDRCERIGRATDRH